MKPPIFGKKEVEVALWNMLVAKGRFDLIELLHKADTGELKGRVVRFKHYSRTTMWRTVKEFLELRGICVEIQSNGG